MPELTEAKLSEAEIYQYLLGWTGADRNSLKRYLGYTIKLENPSEAAKEIERFLDRQMQDAQVKE